MNINNGNGDNNRTSVGVAQWVVPKRNPNLKSAINKENAKQIRTRQLVNNSSPILRQHSNSNLSSIIIENNQTHQRLTQSQHVDHPSQDQNKIDDAIYKTICVIVEQYLTELRQHQKQINLARSRLLRRAYHSSTDESFIAHNDISRLRVRDEQTKAIETIKQLTNYLKELSTLRRHENEELDSVSEGIHNKLSDLRNDIIHTLNDFVIANSDIDIPIVDPEDPTSEERDYDLCIEAQRSLRDNQIANRSGDSKVLSASSAGSSSIYVTTKTTTTTTTKSNETNFRPLAAKNCNTLSDEFQSSEEPNCDDKHKLLAIHDDYQVIELNKRRREILKLEKNTVELRNLFVDFYNLVKTQGEQVDTIEDNLVIAAQHISEGRNHLQPRPIKGLTVLIPMTGCITGALIGGPIGFILGGKLGGVTIICATSLLGLLSSLGAQKCIGNKRMKSD